ncbi:MAG: aspartate/glutamate racemase family protein [Anaerolineales bacterium]|nr:aspartate/glutamate racemase family protein [Anaerolineales bacterium]
MKTIGLIGGMSWESSIEYYRIINQVTQKELGGVHSAKIVLVSLDFAEIEELQNKGDWEEATRIMVDAARLVEKGGADLILICTNTMHLMAEEIQGKIKIPLLHIADATARAVKQKNIITIGLLGTRFTMEKEFYRGRLETHHQLNVLIPEQEQREMIHRVIYDELVRGIINDSSRKIYQDVIKSLVERGAQGIILGCTEIGLLVKPEDVPIPVFDTMEIHALSAVEAALGKVSFDG